MPTKKNSSGKQQAYDKETGRYIGEASSKAPDNEKVNRFLAKGFTRNEANQLKESYSDDQIEDIKRLVDKGYEISTINKLEDKEIKRLAKDKYDYKTAKIEWEETSNGRKPKNGIFDTSTLGGFSIYSEDLKDKRNIIQMTPKEYFKLCAEGFDTDYKEQIHQIEAEPDHINELEDVILEDGKQFPMPFVDMDKPSSQEGRHRMYIAGELFGWDTKFPVLAVNGSKTKLMSDSAKLQAEKYLSEYQVYKVNVSDLIEDSKLLRNRDTLETRKKYWGDNYWEYKFDSDKYDQDINNPIRVIIKGGRYVVEDGRHRLIALKNDGYKKVEILLRMGD